MSASDEVTQSLVLEHELFPLRAKCTFLLREKAYLLGAVEACPDCYLLAYSLAHEISAATSKSEGDGGDENWYLFFTW